MSVTVEQEAFEMPADNKKVMLKIEEVHLHSCGVFSNVYRGNLKEPVEKKVAIKKTWPEKGERNFEFIFLTGRERAKHKNIIQMIYAFSHNYGSKVCESYVFDYMPSTLADILKQRINDLDIRLYTWQIFSGLKYLEEHYVIHRDLKPVNILVDHATGALKISDFGSSKIILRQKASNFYQVTRFYRPPELLMKAVDYDTTVDVWSAGCCVAEMIRRNVVFPGRDSGHQLKLYCRCFGAPNDSDIRAMKANDKLEPEYSKYTKGYGLVKLLPDSTLEQLHFLKKILVYNPERRLRGKDLLKDDFFKPLFKSGATRSNDQPISQIISYDDYKRATEMDDVTISRRLSLLALSMKPPKDHAIPLCEKSNSYENVVVRRSTLIPKEQKMAREMRSREDNSKEDLSHDRKGPSSDEFKSEFEVRKRKSNELVKKKSRENIYKTKSMLKSVMRPAEKLEKSDN